MSVLVIFAKEKLFACFAVDFHSGLTDVERFFQAMPWFPALFLCYYRALHSCRNLLSSFVTSVHIAVVRFATM